MTGTLASAAALAALTLVGVAAVGDVIRREIPDAVSVATFALAIGFGIVTPGFVWWSHLAAPVVMFGFGLLAFSRGWLGGGDVKLMTALAAWSGLAGLPLLFIATSVAGGGLTLLLAGRQRLTGPAAPAVTHVPYAVAIFAGTLWWLWASGGGPLAAPHPAGDQRPVARAMAT